MNSKTSLLLTVWVLTFINAHADLTIAPAGNFTTDAGQSGRSISTIKANSTLTAGTTYNVSTSVSSPGLLSDAFITDVGAGLDDTAVTSLYNPGYANANGLNIGELWVDFDVPAGTPPGDYPVNVTINYTPKPPPIGNTVTQSYTFIVTVPLPERAPEPGQMMAGTLLLAVGALACIRRQRL